MAKIIVTDTAGATRTIAATTGRPLMEAIRDAGFDDLMAMCGGACACATCHVYISDPERLIALPPMKADEDGLLEGADDRQANSRLSCQIRVTDAMDGLHVTIAPMS